jgi:hypothetical protein
VDRCDGGPDRLGQAGVDASEGDLLAVDELVDDRAGLRGRRLADVGGHREGQTRAHAGADRAQGDEVGGLLGLRPLVARDADDEVAAVAGRQQGGVEVVAAGAEARRGDEVEVVDGGSRERG